MKEELFPTLILLVWLWKWQNHHLLVLYRKHKALTLTNYSLFIPSIPFPPSLSVMTYKGLFKTWPDLEFSFWPLFPRHINGQPCYIYYENLTVATLSSTSVFPLIQLLPSVWNVLFSFDCTFPKTVSSFSLKLCGLHLYSSQILLSIL